MGATIKTKMRNKYADVTAAAAASSSSPKLMSKSNVMVSHKADVLFWQMSLLRENIDVDK